MNLNSIVIINLTSPTQRFFGRLVDLNPAGITVRGVDLNAFEDWINTIAASEESGVRPTTTFFPLHRVEKIILDEAIGVMPSLSNTFRTKVGSFVEDHLE